MLELKVVLYFRLIPFVLFISLLHNNLLINGEDIGIQGIQSKIEIKYKDFET